MCEKCADLRRLGPPGVAVPILEAALVKALLSDAAMPTIISKMADVFGGEGAEKALREALLRAANHLHVGKIEVRIVPREPEPEPEPKKRCHVDTRKVKAEVGKTVKEILRKVQEEGDEKGKGKKR